MADGLTVFETAEALGTSRQTVCAYLRNGTLDGSRGGARTWRVERESVERFLDRYGKLDGSRRRKSPAARDEAEIRRLADEVAALKGDAGKDILAIVRERDNLRARLMTAEDALARMRDVSELQRQADSERDEVVSHLLTALAAADRADKLRRAALESLEDGLAAGAIPEYPDVPDRA